MKALSSVGSVFVFLFMLSVSCSDDDATDNSKAPVIIDVTPTSGAVGSVVAITGTDFGATSGTNIVRFNGTIAVMNTISTTQIGVTVPAGATTGKVTVTVNGKTATSPVDFTVN